MEFFPLQASSREVDRRGKDKRWGHTENEKIVEKAYKKGQLWNEKRK